MSNLTDASQSRIILMPAAEAIGPWRTLALALARGGHRLAFADASQGLDDQLRDLQFEVERAGGISLAGPADDPAWAREAFGALDLVLTPSPGEAAREAERCFKGQPKATGGRNPAPLRRVVLLTPEPGAGEPCVVERTSAGTGAPLWRVSAPAPLSTRAAEQIAERITQP